MLSAGLILGAAFSASSAMAQMENLDPAAVTAATRYSLPLLFDGYLTRCSGTLDPAGYANSNARKLRAKFSQGAADAWPAARTLVLEMAEGEAAGSTDLIGNMPDDALRPFVDGLIPSMIAQEIELEQCEVIERVLELFDPMPADNLAGMVGLFTEFASDEAGQRPEMTESRRRKLSEQEQSE
jgi:hypothetical protein